MKKAYEVAYKDGHGLKTITVKGYTLIGALFKCSDYMNVHEDAVAINEISFERQHALNIASAIRDADTWLDCEDECAELCRLAGMGFEWKKANGDTFEAVLIEAPKRLDVEI